MEQQTEAWILNKMKRHRFIGGKHTDIDNLRKGVHPKFYKDVDDAVKRLVKKGYIVVKITSYGKHVSLNPHLMKEINDIIQKYYTEEIFD